MTDCTFTKIEFPSCCKRRLEADFAGGEISSNGGALLLSLADRRVGLLSGLGRRLADRRQAGKVKHGLTGLLRQRVFALALGDEDVNDHEVLRDDLVLQTACGGDRRLASPSTVGRLERAADRSWAWAAHETLVESFIASTEDAPEELVLDFDCTDDAVHGCQEGRFFHGYYDHYCFLPLYVFCGDQLLVSYLRPSNIDQAKHAWAILALLVKRLRQAWPAVRLTVRADSGFCRHKMLSWCERHEVGYIVGLAKNARINDQAARGMALAAAAYERTGEKQRVRRSMLWGEELEQGPSRDCPPRAWAQGSQPALRHHQPRRRGEGALRASLLRPRRDGEPHQGAAAGPLRRPHQLPQVVAQPVPSDPLIARLYADRDDPPAGAEGHHDGPGSGGHYPPQAPEDRRRRHTQHRRVRLHLSSACPYQDLVRLAAIRLKPG